MCGNFILPIGLNYVYSFNRLVRAKLICARYYTFSKQDLSVGQDLQDTLKANQDSCVGMAPL